MRNAIKIMAATVAFVFAFTALADTEKVGNYTWTYKVYDANTVEIYNDGNAAVSPLPTGSLTIPSSLGGKSKIRLGANIFKGCSELKHVIISASVTTISYGAFTNCSGLESFFVAGNRYQSSTTGLLLTADGKWLIHGVNGNVVIPDGVERICWDAFDSLSGLTSVTIPSSVKNIEGCAFYNCIGLKSVELPASVANIASRTFYGCTGLKNVYMSDSVTNIADRAFCGCTSLSSVHIPSSVKSIGDRAFDGAGLTEVHFDGRAGKINADFNSAFTNTTYRATVNANDNFASAKAISGASGLVTGLNIFATDELNEPLWDDFEDGRYTMWFKWTAPSSAKAALFHTCHSDFDTVLGVFKGSSRSSLTKVATDDDACDNNTSRVKFAVTGGATYYICVAGNWGRGSFRLAWTTTTGSSAIVSAYGTLCGVVGDCPATLTIPSSDASGYPILRIADSAFNCGFDPSAGNITKVTIPDSVTSVGRSAFSGCNDSVFDTTTIPGVKMVDGWAVGRTTAPSGNLDLTGARGIAGNVFSSCKNLTSVTIPSTVNGIGNWAFSYCTGLTSVEIPDSVKFLGENAFYDCNNLESVRMPLGLYEPGIEAWTFGACHDNLVFVCVDSSTGEHFFIKSKSGELIAVITDDGTASVTIPDGVKAIGPEAFSGCVGLKSVTIPDSLTTIGQKAFENCRTLTSVTIPDSVTFLGEDAFYNCSNLESVRMPLSLYKSGLVSFSFRNCSADLEIACVNSSGMEFCFNNSGELYEVDLNGATSVTIPAGVTSIGAYVFEDCDSLTSVTIPASVTVVNQHAFDGCSGLKSFSVASDSLIFKSVNGLLLSKDGKTLVCGVNGNVTIPGSVTSIGYAAFCGMVNLTSVTIPSGVTSIDVYAFDHCRGLASVVIPSSVTSIGEGAFRFCCDELTSVTIPDSVTSIGNYAFQDCDYLTSASLPARFKGNLNSTVFDGCSSSLVVTYRDAPSGAKYTLTRDPNGGKYQGKTEATVTANGLQTGTGNFWSIGMADCSGYAFDGWWTAASGGVKVYGVDGNCIAGTYWDSSKHYIYNGNLTVYAHWRALSGNKYTLTRNPNGGTYQGKTTATVTANGLQTGTGNFWSIGMSDRAGYAFDGWWTAADGGVKVYGVDGNCVFGEYWSLGKAYTHEGDLTVYAHWKALSGNKYTLTRNPNGGKYQGKTDAIVTANGLQTGTGNFWSIGMADRSGYAFDGWWTAASGGVKVYGADGNCVFGEYWSTGKAYTHEGDLTVYAHWRALSGKKYTLTRDPNGGKYQGKTTAIVTANGLQTGTGNYWSIGMADRSGYAFDGWWTAASGGVKVYGVDGNCVFGEYWSTGKAYTHEGDLTVYAHWTAGAAKYTLTRNPNGGVYQGKTAATVTANGLVYGTGNYWDIQVPTRDGYTFDGWWTAATGGTKVYGTDGKCVLGTEYWTADKKYVHAGDLTVYAHWTATAAKYTLTRNPNGGVYQGKTAATVTANGLVYGTGNFWDIQVPTRDGYTFDGWWTEATGGTKVYGTDGKCVLGTEYWTTDKKYVHAGDLTVYAHWTATAAKYTLTRNPNGGVYQGKTAATVTANGLVYGTGNFWDIQVPTRDGYTFDGWWTEATGGTKVYGTDGKCVLGTAYWTTDKKYVHAGDLTVYAHWTATAEQYTLTRDPNGGVYQGKTEATVTANGLIKGTGNFWTIGVPTRDGYTFAGWFTKSSGGVMVYDAEGKCVPGNYWTPDKKYKRSSDLKVYAHWALTGKKLTLNCYPNGGTYKGVTGATTMVGGLVVGSSVNSDIGVPTLSDCTFLGWFTDPIVGTKVYDNSGKCVAGTYWNASGQYIYDDELTLYAKWVDNYSTFDLTLNPNGGTYKGSSEATTVEKGLVVGLSSNCEVGVPTRSGYKFNGWFTEEAGGEKVYDASGKCIAGTYWTSSRLYCYDSSLWLYAQWTKVSAMVVAESRAESGGAASEALPEWAVGSTFDGSVAGADGGIVGTVTLTVSEDGAFSGKMLKDGLVRTLSADEVTFAIDESSPFRRVVATGDGWVAWQNLWKTEQLAAVAAAFAEAPVLVTPDGVELKFSSSGVVTAKLGAYSCSAVLIPQADGICALYIYFPPEAGVFDGYTAKVEVDWSGTSFLPADFPQE